MKDQIVLENGTSRIIKGAETTPENFADFRTALLNGEITVDIGLNDNGCVEVGTPLNKENLLTDETAEALGLTSDDPTIDEALSKVAYDLGDKEFFIIHATKNENTISNVDKTYEEMIEAKEAEKRLVMIVEEGNIQYVFDYMRYNGQNSLYFSFDESQITHVLTAKSTGVTYSKITLAKSTDITALKYKAGDTISFSGAIVCGYITNAGTEYVFAIPLNKTVAANNVSLSGGQLRIRCNGGYVGGSNYFDITSVYNDTVQVDIRGTMLRVYCKANTAPSRGNECNNMTAIADFTGTITFS